MGEISHTEFLTIFRRRVELGILPDPNLDSDGVCDSIDDVYLAELKQRLALARNY